MHQGYAAFERGHPLLASGRKAVWALLVCRTAVLAGHVQACPEGHSERVWYNSCRHRLCPPCRWRQTERWLARQKTRLWACAHDQAIFTRPAALSGLGLTNVKLRTDLLLVTVRQRRSALRGDANDLGAQPGMMATLPTWSQTLVWPPHLHGLVTGGGVSDAGEGRAVRHGFLRPGRVGMARFWGTLRAALRQGVAQGQLRLPEGRSHQQLANLFNKLGRTTWNVHIRERYPHGVGVLTYLARDIRGGPLANRRLVACEHGRVTFRYRIKGDGSDGPQNDLMTWPSEAFIRRSLRHVPEPGTRVVRGYGLYAPTKGEALAVCRAQLGQGPVAAPAVLDWQTACQDRGDDHPARCPVGGRRLVCLGVLLPWRIPPPSAIPWEVVA